MSNRSLRVWADTAPLGERSVPVIQPCTHDFRVMPSHYGGGSIMVTADSRGLRALRNLFAVASQFRKGIVYLPHGGERVTWNADEACDLVLAHHSLQLPRGSWKGMRQYLRKSSVRGIDIPDIKETPLHWSRGRRDSNERADLAVHGRTVFIIGSRAIFEHLAVLSDWNGRNYGEGSHTHLFDLARSEPGAGHQGDLTLMWSGMWGTA